MKVFGHLGQLLNVGENIGEVLVPPFQSELIVDKVGTTQTHVPEVQAEQKLLKYILLH